MSADRSVIEALEAALAAAPEAFSVRLHLAGLLLERGEAGAALEHYAAVLGRQPAHIAALEGAARASAAAGATEREAGYRQILAALRGAPGTIELAGTDDGGTEGVGNEGDSGRHDDERTDMPATRGARAVVVRSVSASGSSIAMGRPSSPRRLKSRP